MDLNEEIADVLTKNPNVEDEEDVLLELKHISDEKRIRLEKNMRNYLIGISFGILLGMTAGVYFDQVTAFGFGGIVVGVGTAFMIHISRK